MACYEPCIYKRDAARLGRRVEALENGMELGKLQKALEAERRAKLSAVNDRDRLKHQVEDRNEAICKLKETIEHYKDQQVWAEETAEKEKKTWETAIRSLKKQIGKLQKDLSDAQWRQEKDQKDLKKQYEKELKQQKACYEARISEMEKKYQTELAEKDELIRVLTEHLQEGGGGLHGKKPGDGNTPKVEKAQTDSTTSSIPPGQDPNHPTITNNRTPSGRKPGAQEGHEAHPRKDYKPTTVVVLPPPREVLEHPDDYYAIGTISKRVVSVRLLVEVTEYQGIRYRNHKTREVVHSEFPENVGHLETNYDQSIDALAAYLHSVCNVPYNKIQELLREATEGQGLDISTGKLADLEKRFSSLTGEERADIAEKLFRGRVLNIDGTGARVNGKQKQVLIMCNRENVLFRMTGCKGEKSVEGTPAENYQGVTVSDSESTFAKLGTQNQRCNVHELRYLKRASQDTPDLKWPSRMRELLQRIQHERNTGLEQGKNCMSAQERKKVSAEYDSCLIQGITEYREHFPELFHNHLVRSKGRLEGCAGRYGVDADIASMTEATAGKMRKECEIYPEMPTDALNSLVKDINLLIRLMVDKEHYLLFLEDYTIPPHNNDAEKCARTVKTHLKPNGGMRSEEYTGYYADTVSVLETEHRQGRSRLSKLGDVFGRTVKAVKKKMAEGREKQKELEDAVTGET